MNSPKYTLSSSDWKKWSWNLLVFTAPTLALFFGALAGGADWKVASGIAALALYQALADLFKKYKSGN